MSTTARLIRRTVPARFRPIGYLNHLTLKRTGRQVRSGPFRGMKYVTDSVGSCFIPKLLGTYESELAAKIEVICRRAPKSVVDIGAAEGYYAVGLALRIPDARVIAFEMDQQGQCALSATAKLNDVTDRVQVLGKCEPDNLAAVLTGNPDTAIICDVEGDEERLLDPEVLPALRQATLLVEMHEFIRRGVTDELRRRFARSHEIELIWQQPRDRAEFPWRTLGTMLLPTSYLDWAVSEWRPQRMLWLWMTPRPSNG